MNALKTLSALLLTLTFAASPAYAQNLDVSVGGGVDAGATTSLDIEADADTSMDDGHADATVGTDTAAGFSLTRTHASVTNSSGTPMSAESVNTANDLEVYAASALRTHDSFDGVDVTSDRLSFRFKEDAKLFGFIPHKVTSRVEVSGDGAVTVTRPWYSFLASGLSTDTTASIEARVRTALGESSGTMTARTQALVLAEIVSALEGSADTSARVDASADISGVEADAAGNASGSLEVAPN